MTPDRNDKAQLIGTGSERVPTQSLVEEMRRGASRRAVSVESVADRTVLDSTGAADSGTALREQAEFNRSLVSVLKAITYELAGIEQQVGGWQADHARIT